MDFEIDLEKTLWHEIGHFCIDLLDVESNPNYNIEDFKVSYYKIAISDHKWGGSVKMLPSLKWEDLIEDIDKTSFAILGLISGCMFQTIFFNELKKSNVSFSDCFCLYDRCAGKADSHFFYIINSKLRNKFGHKKSYVEFSEIEVLDIYYKIIVENQSFLSEINKLVVKYKDKICNLFQESVNKDEFHYHFDNIELEFLRMELHRIMHETSFRNSVIELHNKIKQEILA